jgi:hypothetical protein
VLDRAGRAALLLRWPLVRRALLPGACVAMAAGSLALPAAPTFDPWAWIGFGRGLVDPAIDFSTLGRTGWKPLPVLFTAPLGLLGDAAPSLWLVVVPSAGLAATVLAFGLAARVGGQVAGLVAAFAFVASSDWLRYLRRQHRAGGRGPSARRGRTAPAASDGPVRSCWLHSPASPDRSSGRSWSATAWSSG